MTESQSSYGYFQSPEEVAKLATSLGLSVPEFMKLFMDNLFEATERSWHTAQRFAAKIVDVSRENTAGLDANGKPLQRVIVTYLSGVNYQKKQTIALSGLLSTSEDNFTRQLAKKFHALVGQEVFIYNAHEKSNNPRDYREFSIAIDVENRQPAISETSQLDI